MQKTLTVLCASAALALAASVLVTVPASANGGDFFNELAESWGANVDTGTPFFGFVRDERGRAIPRAIVTATVQRGLDGESVTIISDNLGHYRIPGLGKEILAKDVTIECAKAGYRAIQQDRRIMRTIPKAPVEVNCKLSPVTTASAS